MHKIQIPLWEIYKPINNKTFVTGSNENLSDLGVKLCTDSKIQLDTLQYHSSSTDIHKCCLASSKTRALG